MSRPPYPHRLVQTSLREVLDWHGACRCGEPVTAKHRWQVPAEWGAGCPIALREALAETEARAERAEAERDATVDEARRFRDLVRHQRGPLHDADLLTDEEYAALASDAGAVARLRGYDEMRRELAEAGSRYRDHLPAVITATEPVQLDRPMVMAEVVGERSCFTCKYDHHRPGLAAHWCSADGGTDPRFGLYMVKSGALGTDDLMPTNRTVRCPGWSPKDPL